MSDNEKGDNQVQEKRVVEMLRKDGRLTALAGQSRWGKTHWLRQQVRSAVRALNWDPRGEFLEEGFTKVQTIPELAGMLREIGEQPAQISYWGNLEDFDAWCRLAYAWGQLWPAAISADEIADVTHAAKAPAGWGELIRKGLFFGNHIYAITQRPQECDKTVWGNATVLHSYGFISPDDQEYMARRLAVPLEQFAALQKYQFCERSAGSYMASWGGPGMHHDGPNIN